MVAGSDVEEDAKLISGEVETTGSKGLPEKCSVLIGCDVDGRAGGLELCPGDLVAITFCPGDLAAIT